LAKIVANAFVKPARSCVSMAGLPARAKNLVFQNYPSRKSLDITPIPSAVGDDENRQTLPEMHL